MKKNIIIIANILIAAFLVSCNGQQREHENPGPDSRDSLYQQERLIKYNTVVYSKMLSMVEPGDIITRCGIDLTSEILRRLNKKDRTFSHIGIASIENDTLFVYHAIGGEFNPDQKLRREMLWSFAHPDDNRMVALFRLNINKTQKKQIIAEVQRLYHNGVMFDMDFDWKTNDRLYCAEFVAKSVTHILEDTNYFHHTYIMGKEGIAVDDITTNKNCKLIGKWGY